MGRLSSPHVNIQTTIIEGSGIEYIIFLVFTTAVPIGLLLILFLGCVMHFCGCLGVLLLLPVMAGSQIGHELFNFALL
jgi:hypothetical protein